MRGGANSLRAGGYELAGGEVVRFDDWYRPRHPDLTVLFLTQLSDGLGVIWGPSSGEEGRKYRIDPALHLGLTWQTALSPQTTVTLGLQTLWGGRLREGAYLADYGPFGMATVNCRLAATELPPTQTLDYLVNENARTENRITLRVDHRF